MRVSTISRTTKETAIALSLNLDGTGKSNISTGIGFLDHMLTLFSFHSGIDLTIECNGDIEVDDHHTTEDIGLALGQALLEALGDKKGVNRYGSSYVPMDETLARVVIDFSGRPYLIYDAKLEREKVGMLDTQNVKEFFKSVSNEAKMNCHMEVLYGENDHHKIEALFKAFGRAIKEACKIVSNEIPSTKGVL
ncbi:imidazoleglycerol-phosphate dehydratase HisB [Bacillus sp. RG28]|uniref:Imidazoleglycerol-phosphate dehydratase n=1 Tax=Gottfriedia endophytica TaxID=2820819 RepID=A0A940NQJ3_9BACI|nr:imidazoleglycerol-phosphate dehydratase HisB [Gottfriedia endophytica]MBP0725723.1 imidazoleglycerol-phosphate dehydratase HisB [Gottfriedia endophytica]